MKAEENASAARRARADGSGRSSARALGVPPAAKKATFAAYFQRIAAHKGSKRAIVAVSHALLVVCYYLLKRKCHFQDLGVNYFDQLNHERLTKYFVKRLTRLGHRVTLEPCPAAA
jgi:transposase